MDSLYKLGITFSFPFQDYFLIDLESQCTVKFKNRKARGESVLQKEYNFISVANFNQNNFKRLH